MSDKKYICPEHTIRNILELKSIGHNVPTANAFFKPIGVISPPKGEEHVDGNADKIRAARNVAKERQSVTMREDQNSDAYSSEPGWQPTKKTIGDVAFSKLKKAKSNAAQWKLGREAAKKGETLSAYKELPSEKIKHTVADILAKVSGDPRKAETAAEMLGKLGSTATMGGADVAMNTLDAGAAALQGRTKEAVTKGTEAAIGAATFAAGGVLSNKIASKYAAPRVGAYVGDAVGAKINPKEFDIIKPNADAPPSASKFAKEFAASNQKPASTTKAKDYDVTGPRTEAPIKVDASTPDARMWNPKTGKYYKSKAESEAATKEFDLAVAARKADALDQAKKVADTSVPPTKPFDLKMEPAPTVANKSKTSVFPESPKMSNKKVVFPDTEVKLTKVAEKPPNDFKLAEPPTSKGSLVVTRPEPPTNLSAAQRAAEVEAIPTGQEKVFPGQGKITTKATADKTIDLSTKEYDVVPGTTVSTKVKPVTQTKVVTDPRVNLKVAALPKTETKTKVVTDPRVNLKLDNKKPSKEEPSKEKGKKPWLPSLPGFTPGQSQGFYQDSNVPVSIYKHMPKEYMENYNEESRYDIEAVPRPNSKDKKNRTRQAEIIRKVIEEKKATKKNETVVDVKPKLNNPDPGTN